jgi:hypothetical protein
MRWILSLALLPLSFAQDLPPLADFVLNPSLPTGLVNRVAVAPNGEVWMVGGGALPIDTPVTPGTGPGSLQIRVARYDALLQRVLYEGVLGGTLAGRADTLTTDAGGNLYIGGYTMSPDFRLTTRLNGTSAVGAFVAKLNPSVVSEN